MPYVGLEVHKQFVFAPRLNAGSKLGATVGLGPPSAPSLQQRQRCHSRWS